MKIQTSILITLAWVGTAQAQRFGHQSAPRPAPAPAFHPAPAPAYRPAPAPRPMPSINGGARNYGNHDFGRPAPMPVRVQARPAPRVPVPEGRGRVYVPPVNVYHGGGYRVHPYYYHPYHPYIWGPHWHPFGFFLPFLPSDAFYFTFSNQPYYYDDGVYYEPSQGGYTAVSPPSGATVASLPEGAETTQVGDDTYYYYGGVFYVYTDQGYQVVTAPVGAVVNELPEGAQQQTDANGQTYFVVNNTAFAPISQDGQDAYEVIQMGN